MRTKTRTFLTLIMALILVGSVWITTDDAEAAQQDVFQRVGAFCASGFGDVECDALTDREKWCTKIGSYYVWAWENGPYDSPNWAIYTSDSLTGKKTCIKECSEDAWGNPSVISDGEMIYYADGDTIYSMDMNGNNEKRILITYDEVKVAGFYNGQLFYTVPDEDYYYSYKLYSLDIYTEETKYIGPFSVGDCYGQYLICSDGDYQLHTGDNLYLYDAARDQTQSLPVKKGVATIGDYGIRFFDGSDIKTCDLEGKNVKLLQNVYSTDLYNREDWEDSPGMFFWMNDLAAAYGYWNEAVGSQMPMHKCEFNAPPASDNLISEILDSTSTKYNPFLAKKLMEAAYKAYDKKSDVKSYLEGEGIENVKCEKYFDDPYDSRYGSDTAAYSIGYNETNQGRIVTIVIRGSYGGFDFDAPDWKSNFNVTSSLLSISRSLHDGFDIAAEEIYSMLKERDLFRTNGTKYVITGHSRGGGVGNLLAYHLMVDGVSQENLFAYNFACPDTAKDAFPNFNLNGVFDNIFNIGECGDLVTKVPGLAGDFGPLSMPGVVWGKYGRSVWFAEDWDNFEDNDWTFEAHDQGNYLEFMKKVKPFSYYKTWSQMQSKSLNNKLRAALSVIACPVDVVAKDSSGNTLASVIDGDLRYTRQADGKVLALTDGEVKSFLPLNGADIHYEITGTGSGTMEYSAYQVDGSDESGAEIQTYSHVPIQTNSSFLAKAGLSEATLAVSDRYGEVIGLVGADGTTYPIDPEQLSYDVADCVYDGMAQEPSVEVTIGGLPVSRSCYSLSYVDNVNVGEGSVIVSTSTGALNVAFSINPKPTALMNLTKAKKGFTVKWTKLTEKMSTKHITGYQVQYSLSPDFSSRCKTKPVKGFKKTSLKVKKLKSKKTYYVRVRTYMKVDGKTYTSPWSNEAPVRTK